MTPENNETYRTALGCCATTIDELVVHAFYAQPTLRGAEAVARICNERGYNTTAEEVLAEA
jgi:hypothetical protein